MSVDITYTLGARGVATVQTLDKRLDTAAALRPTINEPLVIKNEAETITLFNGKIFKVTPPIIVALDEVSSKNAEMLPGSKNSSTLPGVIRQIHPVIVWSRLNTSATVTWSNDCAASVGPFAMLGSSVIP